MAGAVPDIEIKVSADPTQAKRGLQQVSQSLNATTKSAGNTSHSLRMASMQLSQMAQQSMATGNVLQAVAIQLPDLALGFGAVGIAGGVLGGVLLQTLGPAMQDAIFGAEDLDTAMESLEDQVASLSEIHGFLSEDLDDVTKKYGEYTESVLRAAAAEAQIKIGKLRREFGDLALALDEVSKYDETPDRIAAHADKLARELGISVDEALALKDALMDIDAAQGIEGHREALEGFLEVADDIGLSLSDLPPTLEEAVLAMISFNREMAEGEQIAKLLADQVAAINIGGIEGLDELNDEERKKSRKSRGGGSRRDPLAEIKRNLERLQEGFLSEEELAIQHYERDQMMLEEALNNKLLTRERFAELERSLATDHARDLLDIALKGRQADLNSLGATFGQMASAAQGHNDALVRIFGTAQAAMALSSAWTAYAQTLADPTAFTFFEKFARAGAVLSAGLGAVSAIKGATGVGGGASSQEAVQAQQGPLNVRLSGLSSDEMISGANLETLFDRLQDEAGDRGIRVAFA